jgi:signal transduction histidine kinase
LFEHVILDIDRNKIAIVLKNILSNAFKFLINSAEKKIDINISIIGINTQINMDDQMASYSCMLKVEIKDTGPGISQVPTVFIPDHIITMIHSCIIHCTYLLYILYV